MDYLRVRNWEKYQDTAGHNTEYVKLYPMILLDMEFMLLADKERLTFLLLLLAYAGVNCNKIPNDPDTIMHLCHLYEEPDIERMKRAGLLEDWCEDAHQEMLEKHKEKLKKWRDNKRNQRAKKGVSAMSSSGQGEDMSNVPSETETETETRSRACTKSGDLPRANGKDFERFWESWPKKVNKKKAKQAWVSKKFPLEMVDTLIADVQNRTQSDRQWRDGFIPHCSTYLNGERWEDEVEVDKKTTQGDIYARG